MLLLLLLASVSLCTGELDAEYTPSDEERLHTKLLKHYGKFARPGNHSTSVPVDVSITFPRFENLDTATDTMTLSFFFYMGWTDTRLQWNYSEYGDIKVTRVRSADIWKPDMEVFNTSPFHRGETLDTNAIIVHNGFVMYVPAKTVSFFCPVDLTSFPYDTQTCKLVMGPWTYHQGEVNLTYTSKYKERVGIEVTGDELAMTYHPQWTLNKMSAMTFPFKFACCPELFPLLDVDVAVTRIASYYRIVLVGPAVFLAILIPVIFLLPADPTCRTTYGMILLMCMTLMILILQEAVTFNHASVPVIAVFYFAIMVVQVFSIICSTIIVNLVDNGRRRKPLPAWLGSLCLNSRVIRRLLCLDVKFSTFLDPDSITTGMRLLEEAQDMAHDTGLDNVDITSGSSHDQLQEVANNTKIMAGKVLRSSAYEKLQRDWQEVARCLDRVFFIIFVVLTILVTISTIL